MTAKTRITIEVTPEQADAISAALDLYSRLAIGQVREISHAFRFERVPTYRVENADRFCEIADRIESLTHEMSRALGFLPGASLGIHNTRVHLAGRRAYEVQKVLDKALADHRDPNPNSPGVTHYGLQLRCTHDPEPVATVIQCEKEDVL
ncbi:hypothetical protein [Hydrogenophaga sp. NFH-34]|uniref:hypothetical protein n=1 Tax=Hydrogenophaga sp. NFH-34 TaxID=2744446 RepID=UPI001F2D4D7B|nr:hypothetical protein [Hydrogenophaga sp. NFH-34]